MSVEIVVARLVVRDHGIGIKPQDLSRIFESFERIYSNRNVGGIGLGLYIVRQIVETHGSMVHATSEPGQSSASIVDLPLEAPLLDSG